ncbi:uncharacterized protein [Henckelia pumila]|uniref:uncharacterized protein n=1 Tax=Henckelia pumila TaxID=405737 RepID=UPI003C6DCDD0
MQKIDPEHRLYHTLYTEDLRRVNATSWLVEIFGPIGIPDEPSEQEFITFLRNEVVICKLLHELRPDSFPQPGSFPQIEGEASSGTNFSHVARFKNVHNFISLMNELNIHAPEASIFSQDDFKEGASKNLVDCILGVKNYLQEKQFTIVIPPKPNQEPQTAPAGLSRYLPACVKSWSLGFLFSQRTLGVVSAICSLAAAVLCVPVEFSVEESVIHQVLLLTWAEIGTFLIVLFLPAAMWGKSHFINEYLPKKPQLQMRNILIWATRIAILLMSSLTMWLSTVIKPVEKYGKIVVVSTCLLLTSTVLCEAALLDDSGSGGVTELIICFLLLQVSQTFHLKPVISLGVSLLCYIGKEFVMFVMRGMQQKINQAKEEKNARTREGK